MAHPQIVHTCLTTPLFSIVRIVHECIGQRSSKIVACTITTIRRARETYACNASAATVTLACGCGVARRSAPGHAYLCISAASRLHISMLYVSRQHLHCISAAELRCISGASALHLGRISAASRPSSNSTGAALTERRRLVRRSWTPSSTQVRPRRRRRRSRRTLTSGR